MKYSLLLGANNRQAVKEVIQRLDLAVELADIGGIPPARVIFLPEES